jgi:serine/threonine protein kinase
VLVAVKRINMWHLRKIKHAEMTLKREISIHRKLKHEHVVELIESFGVNEKQKVYVVLEHVPGSSLQEISDSVATDVLPTRMVQRLFRQLFDGLDYIHSRGVVHRDIKPSNLLVTLCGCLKLADFGVAEELSLFEQHDQCSKSKGSPAFQSPEVASGHETFSGCKVDIWAAGVSLYMTTTGRVPFEGASLMHLFEQIANGTYEVPESIVCSERLVDLLYRLLTIDQTARASAKQALAHPWLARTDESATWDEDERRIVEHTMEGRPALSMLTALAKAQGWVGVNTVELTVHSSKLPPLQHEIPPFSPRTAATGGGASDGLRGKSATAPLPAHSFGKACASQSSEQLQVRAGACADVVGLGKPRRTKSMPTASELHMAEWHEAMHSALSRERKGNGKPQGNSGLRCDLTCT